ncbi:zinc finger protein [Macleaya cordata]|uniref:Zinc finger protein n=1 Tax=Macleaya cordata TaxID=56857 RepID=A0A200QD45_MACCD|nr:zinc finger protein [Macleaya cordata]
MVWFQCEVCGENLKKPKLPNHFRICSATKLSCIDCGETFGQQSVQGHNQCISEAEKYGPKGQGKANTPAKAKNQSKQKPDVDINVGLSSHPPWFCSLCNANATSRQTLLLHAEGKKHRAKARAFHTSKQSPKPMEESTQNTTDSAGNTPKEESVTNAEELKGQNPPKDASNNNSSTEANGKVSSEKKRKLDASGNGVASKKEDTDNSADLSNGVVIQAKRKKTEEQDGLLKKSKDTDMDKTGCTEEADSKKIKWKKIITSILKSTPNGALDKWKLRSLVLSTVKETYPAESEANPNLKETFMHKITSSSRFTIDKKKVVRLAAKC